MADQIPIFIVVIVLYMLQFLVCVGNHSLLL